MQNGIDLTLSSEKEQQLDFAQLESLRLLCREIRRCHSDSIGYFGYNGGFLGIPMKSISIPL